MKKVLGLLFIIIGLACIGGSFLLPKEEETTVKKEDKKEEEKLTPPEEKKEDDSTEDSSSDDEEEEWFKYSFDYYNYQLLTPGTYTINNLDDYVISNYIGFDNLKIEGKKACNSDEYYDHQDYFYVTEDNMKALFEETFGAGTYRQFVFRTDAGCNNLYYNEKTKLYEHNCIGGCGDEYTESYDSSIISKTISGDNTIYVEKVVVTDMDERVIATYELTYTIRTADNVFISVTSKKL